MAYFIAGPRGSAPSPGDGLEKAGRGGDDGQEEQGKDQGIEELGDQGGLKDSAG